MSPLPLLLFAALAVAGVTLTSRRMHSRDMLTEALGLPVTLVSLALAAAAMVFW